MSGRTEDHLSRLQALPGLEPTATAEAATLAAMAAAVSSEMAVTLRSPVWARAAAVAAVLGATALIVALALGLREPESPRASAVDEAEFSRLLEDSAALEQLLAALPQRRLMRVSTAGTIVGLEERLALIDGALERADAPDVPPEYRTALLRDRVDVMSALVTVRYAQSPAFEF